MIAANEVADLDFMVKAVLGGESVELPFKDLLKERNLVSIYMRNNTGGCDCQMRLLAGQQQELSKHGWNLIAVSKDTIGSHEKYAKKLDIDFTLVSDPEHDFAKVVDAMTTKKMYGRTFIAPARCSFAMDGDGRVLGLIEKVKTKSFDEQVAALLEELSA